MKNKLLIILCFAMAALFFPLVACDGDNDKKPKNKVSELFLDFEQYAPDFEQLILLEKFGKVNINEDLRFVKSGQYSAQLIPLGTDKSNIKPVLYIPFFSTRFNFNYNKLSKIEQVALEAYNSENNEVSLYAGFIFDKSGNKKSKPEKFTLKPGWNNITVSTNLDILGLSNDVDECFGFYLSFENCAFGKPPGTAVPPIIYIDDIKLIKYETTQKVNDLIYLDKGEICSFEKIYQEHVILFTEGSAAEGRGRIITNEQAGGINPVSGQKMLELTTIPVTENPGNWHAFYFIDKLTEAVNYSQYLQSLEEYEVSFFIYNSNAKNFNFLVQLVWDKWEPTGKWKWEKVYTVKPGNWTEIKIPLKALYAQNELSITKGVCNKILWQDYIGDEMVFYFDDFKIQKIM